MFLGYLFWSPQGGGGGVGSFSYLFEGTYAFFLKKYFYCKKKKNLKSTLLVMNCFETCNKNTIVDMLACVWKERFYTGVGSLFLLASKTDP